MTVKIGFKPHHLIPPFVRNLDREGVIVLMEIMMPMMELMEMLTMMVLMEVAGNTRQVRLVPAIDGVTGHIYIAPCGQNGYINHIFAQVLITVLS